MYEFLELQRMPTIVLREIGNDNFVIVIIIIRTQKKHNLYLVDKMFSKN